MENERPKVGIGVLVFKDVKVLLGKRIGAHAAGVYGGPGGHLEHMESFAECARRETREEAGIEVENIRFLCLTNFQAHAPKHYVDIGLAADWKSGEPQVPEPEKHGPWDWWDLNNLPTPLWASVGNYIKSLNTGQKYFDAPDVREPS